MWCRGAAAGVLRVQAHKRQNNKEKVNRVIERLRSGSFAAAGGW